MLGRSDLIKACAVQGNPNQAIGRPMKVGKEELCGCLAAVEWYVGLDHAAMTDRFEAQVGTVVQRLAGRPGVRARVEMPSEAGQPLPRALLRFDAAVAGQSRDQIMEQLQQGEPSIEVSPEGDDGIYVNPQTLMEGEEVVIADRLAEILG